MSLRNPRKEQPRGVSMQFRIVSQVSRSKFLTCIVLASASCLAQVDPGPRGGAASAGGPFPGLSSDEKAFFTSAQGVFKEVNSVSGTLVGEESGGLGPTFNGNSCAMCHVQPAA